MAERIPTFEEFRTEVKNNFVDGWPNLSDEEVEEYLNGEEAAEKIRRDYNEAVEYLKAGKITEKQMMIGRTSAVGNCLVYMY